MIGIGDIEAARNRIQGRVLRTPVCGSNTLSQRFDLRLLFKLELFQKTGSFKVRGVLNKMSRLCENGRPTGVVSMSSGNHAQALAFGASAFGVPATIVMPDWSRAGKIEATRSYGGEVVLTDQSLMALVGRLEQERGLVLVHPFDDLDIIAGHGTIGLEILEDVPSPDCVLVSIGGGGLSAGISTAIKLRSPKTKVIGIEPEGAPAMFRSLAEGQPVVLDRVDTVADGLAAPFAGKFTLEHVRKYVDEVLLVSDAEIVAAMRFILERLKVVAEPAAAAAFAPIVSEKLRLPAGATVVPVLCGGNIDSESLADLLARFRPR